MVSFQRTIPTLLGCTLATLIGVPAAFGRRFPEQQHPLDAIVGTWQSDTVGGVSARSTCAWTPARLSVLCEQTITTPTGTDRIENFYTFNPAAGRYYFYGPLRPGEPMVPVPLIIADHLWIYADNRRDGHGLAWRTVNDFSKPETYSWRRESSPDGQHWTVVGHGQSRRVKGL